MRYKNNVLDKLTQVDTVVNRIQVQVNRGVKQDDILDSLEKLKEAIENVRGMISVEPDDFAQQFAGQNR
jgi:predicted Zn-ribbon and HTH transcriptional regulator